MQLAFSNSIAFFSRKKKSGLSESDNIYFPIHILTIFKIVFSGCQDYNHFACFQVN